MPSPEWKGIPGFRSKEQARAAKLEASFNRIADAFKRVWQHHFNLLGDPERYAHIYDDMQNRITTFNELSQALLNRKGKEFVSDIHARSDEVEQYEDDVSHHLIDMLNLLGVSKEYMANPKLLAARYPLLYRYHEAVAALINRCEEFGDEYQYQYPDGNPNKTISP